MSASMGQSLTAVTSVAHRVRRSRRGAPPSGLLIGGLAAAALSLIPIVFLFLEVRGISLGEAQRLLWRPRVADLLVNTMGLLAAVSVLSAVVGVAAAWVVER